MKSVLFATTNERKIWQANDALKPYEIEVEQADIEVDEIQSDNPAKIGISKAKAAYQVTRKPVVVNDKFWSIPALNGFPGGYMKDVNKWLTAEDFLALMHNKVDRTGILTEVIAYFDGQQVQEFEEQFTGKFTLEPRGAERYTLERIFIYDGSQKTIAEHAEEGTHARDIQRSAWSKFGEWYKHNG